MNNNTQARTLQFRSALAFVCYLGFSPISLFPQTLPCVLKRFLLTTSRKITTTCAENVLTLTPECFHRHVFCCLCIRPSSLLSLFTLLRPLSLLHPHSTRPISSSLFSVISIDPFSLFARSPLLFCFSDFPHLLCYLCFFRISLFSLRPLSLCFLSFSLYSVFSPILLFSLTLPCVIKRFPLTTGRKTITTCVENVLTLTSGDTEHDVLPLTPTPEFHSQDKPGSGEGWRRHWLPKRGDPHRGEDRRNPSTLPGVIRFLHIMRCSLACQKNQ